MISNIANLDVRLLQRSDALMSERSVSRAAQRPNISQPAVSMALRRLRKLFGDPLFVRTHNAMMPTARALKWLEKGEVDFRIGWIREPSDTLRFKRLYGDYFVCVARKDHPEVGKKIDLKAILYSASCARHDS